MNFRKAYDKPIDEAHSLIAGAEMLVEHSFTEADKAAALDQLAMAQRYLSRAIATKAIWLSRDHDDYEEYPEVRRDKQ